MNLSQLQTRLTELTDLKEFSSLEMFRSELLNSQLQGFEQSVRFKADRYYSNTLYRTEKFEIRLLCWKPLQETPKHRHPENGCLMKIIEGRLIEEKYINNSSMKIIYNKGEVGYIKATESHILKNLDFDSVSLHIYSPSGFYDTLNKQ